MTRAVRNGLLATTTAAIAVGAIWIGEQGLRYTPRTEEGPAASARGMMEYMAKVRGNLATGRIEPADRIAMEAAVNAYGGPKSVGLEWVEMGPDNVGGRIRSVLVDPSNPQVIWCGGVSGGLYKSTNGANTWEKLGAFNENLCISSIAILGNGHLYVGTGATPEGQSGAGGSGFIGDGLFLSTDGGASFTQVFGTTSNWNTGDDWSTVDKIVAHPTEPTKLWVAYGNGLALYDESNNSLTPAPGPPASLCRALEVSMDGSVIVCQIGSVCWLSRDGGASFQQMTLGNNGFPNSQIGRMEFAISPDDNNYLYCMIATGGGQMNGVWATTDKGFNWFRIWPPGFGTNGVPELDIFGDNSQGGWDNVLAVVPGEPDRIWLGGVSLWTTSLNAQPVQLALAFDFPGCFNCVHADVHDITFAPDGQTAYVACDGGIYVSPDKGGVFYAANRFLNITQFYSLAYSPQGKVMGGTQDNGTQYIRLSGGTTAEEAIEVNGGDGFDVEISQIDPNIMFSTVYFGSVSRSADEGTNFGDFYDARVLALGTPGELGGNGLGDFYTNIRLYENWNDVNSQDSVNWLNTTGDTLFFGEVITYKGRMPQVDQYHTITQSMVLPNEELRLQDRVQTLFAVGFSGAQGVWVTRDACQFIENPQWWKVANNAGGSVNVLEWSADGDRLFWGTLDGEVFMVEGFNNAYSLDQADAELGTDLQLSAPVTLLTSGAPVTGLSSDPNDPDRLLVTQGGYGGSQKVRLITGIGGTPTVTNKWNMPAELVGMPVYDGLIHYENPDIFVVGTEFGVMATDDGGTTWTFENTGLDKVPTFQVRQQRWKWNTNPYGPGYLTNQGVIYAGTHGRGAFRSETFLSVADRPGMSGGSSVIGDLSFFPNPAQVQTTVEFDLAERREVVVTVFDLNGRAVRTQRAASFGQGRNRIEIGVNDLATGTYVVELRSGSVKRTGRLVVSR